MFSVRAQKGETNEKGERGMKKWYQVMLLVCACLFVGGCKTKESGVRERKVEFEKIEWTDTVLELAPGGTFAVAENGEFFVVGNYGEICRYSVDGTLLKTYEGCGDVSLFCLSGNNLFYYTYEDELKCLSIESGKVTTVTESLWLTQVNNIVMAGDNLYVFGYSDETGQLEKVLKKVSPKSGKVETVETEEGISAVYGSADGYLYYCTEVSGGTYLYSYGEEKGESKKLYDLTNRPQSEYPIQAFVYEQGTIVYTTILNSLVAMSPEEDKVAIIPAKGALMRGTDLVCVKGNIVYQTFSQETMTAHREKKYLEDIAMESMESATKEVITVFDLHAEQLDAKRIQVASGIATKYIVGDISSDDFLAEVMAGNPEVDIYVMALTSKQAQAMKKKGFYTPLNSSQVIQEYQEACFPYISEEMTTDSGDIWILPVGIDTSAIWYVEENLEQVEVITEQFCTMDSFIELAKDMKEKLKDSQLRTYVTPMLMCFNWVTQYESICCDFAKGIINYNTKEYKELFETVWKGWKIYGQKVVHPYFSSWLEEEEDYGLLGNHPCYIPSRVVYKQCSVGDHLVYGDFSGWRVAQLPVFSEEVQGSYISTVGLVLNPYSSKKELAMTYLETIANNPLGIYGDGYVETTSFLFEDTSIYEGFYDMSQPAAQDVYNIFKEGTLSMPGYPYYFSIVNDYQEGRLTLDEAVNRLQRETEMWLNE